MISFHGWHFMDMNYILTSFRATPQPDIIIFPILRLIDCGLWGTVYGGCNVRATFLIQAAVCFIVYGMVRY